MSIEAPAPRDMAALIAVIEERSTLKFAWENGRDCAGNVAACVEAQVGINPIGSLRWKSKREALAIIAREGGFEAAMDARFDRIPVAMAQRGDIAGVPDYELGIRLMVIEGATLCAPTANGLGRRKRSEMIMAWDASTARVID